MLLKLLFDINISLQTSDRDRNETDQMIRQGGTVSSRSCVCGLVYLSTYGPTMTNHLLQEGDLNASHFLIQFSDTCT